MENCVLKIGEAVECLDRDQSKEVVDYLKTFKEIYPKGYNGNSTGLYGIVPTTKNGFIAEIALENSKRLEKVTKYYSFEEFTQMVSKSKDLVISNYSVF